MKSFKTLSLITLVVVFSLQLSGFISHAEGNPQKLRITLEVNPNNTPLLLQASGGSIDFETSARMDAKRPNDFELWTLVTDPDGNVSAPLYGPAPFSLAPGWKASTRLSQQIPATWSPGHYTLAVQAGFYPGTVYATSSFTFEKLADTAPWYIQRPGNGYYHSAVDFTSNQKGWVAGSRNIILHTEDGGNNWYYQSVPVSATFYDIEFVNDNIGWAVGDPGKILHTIDGGQTWTEQQSGTSHAIFSVFFIDENTGWIAGGKGYDFTASRRFILNTVDGGLTWSSQHLESYKAPLKDIFFIDALSGYAVGEGGAILSTDDGGLTWTEQVSGTALHLEGVYFTDHSTGYAVGRGGTLLYTENGGLSWNSQNLPTGGTLTAISFSDAQTGWIVGGANTSGEIYRTVDGGISWTTQASSASIALTDVSFLSAQSGWVVDAHGAILHTLTGGE